MKIRCEKCYRVLNDNEVYCTRCGEFSPKVQAKMQGKDTPSQIKQYITQLFLAFFVAFFLNGILIVVFSILFDRFFPNVPFGDLDERLPASITLFSHTYAILVTSIALLAMLLIIYRQKIKKVIGFFYSGEILYALWFGIFGLVFFAFLAQKTSISFLPSFFQQIIKSPGELIDFISPRAYAKIFVALISYAFIQEVIFRFALVEILDEATLLPDTLVVIIIALSGAFFDWLAFGFNMPMIIGNLLLQTFLSTTYVFFRRKLIFNIIFRILLISLIFIIL